MVTGDLGALGGAALNHVDLEQEKDLGAATIPLKGTGGNTALDQAARQTLAQHNTIACSGECFWLRSLKGRQSGNCVCLELFPSSV